MKIIDKNKDFYDFCQNIPLFKDDTLTFDRRDSYDLSKEEFARWFRNDYRSHVYSKNGDLNRYILLQVCNKFWLFRLIITKINGEICKDYDLKLIYTWKDYNYKAELIKLSHIRFSYFIKNNEEAIIDAAKRKDYKTEHIFNEFIISRSDKKQIYAHDVRHIPILKNIGVASFIDPIDIYLALEEYFATEKSSKERIESVGLTNDEKITNHGFNLKDSFRGK